MKHCGGFKQMFYEYFVEASGLSFMNTSWLLPGEAGNAISTD